MKSKVTVLLLAASLFAWTGCDKKPGAKSGQGSPKPKGTAADFRDDAEMVASFEKELYELDKKMTSEPATAAMYSRRGDLQMFLTKFEPAVLDYEKLNELDPTQEEKNWRLGIAYYLSGDFEKAQKQLEKYYKADGVDRETGLWYFLATSGLDSVVGAQSRMLKYDQPDRPPFPQLYELYGGAVKTDEFFRGLYDEGLSGKPDVMFYAQLYAGIFEEINERNDAAQRFFRMAYESPWGRKATGGPAYMWQIARILATAPAAAAEEEKKADAGKKAEGGKKEAGEKKGEDGMMGAMEKK